MSYAQRLLSLGVIGLMACGPVVDPGDPSQDSSTGQPEGTDDEDTTETETETGASDDAMDESTGSSGETLDGWCLESLRLAHLAAGPPSLVTHADVNGDGLPELWFSEYQEDSTPLYHAVGLDDAGHFGAITTHDHGRTIHAIVDVDGDGHADAVSFATQPGEPVGWLAGQADGSFSAQLHPLDDAFGVWAQLDDDGIADRIRSPQWGTHVVELGVGNGSFIQLGPLALEESGSASVYPVRDMPGHFGIRADDGGIGFPSYFTQVYGFDAEGDLWLDQSEKYIPEPWAFFDEDGDGVVDIVYFDANADEPGLFLGRGQVGDSFVPELLVPVESGTLKGSVGDFDGDGRIDLIWTPNSTDSAYWARGIDGGFEPPLLVEVSAKTWGPFIEPTDYDGDGRDSWVNHNGANGIDVHELVRCAQ